MSPIASFRPADLAFAARVPAPLRPAPRVCTAAPLASLAALQVEELRRALDLEERLNATLPAIVVGIVGRTLGSLAATLLESSAARAAWLRATLEALGCEAVRRAGHAATAHAHDLDEAQWDADGDAVDVTVALALHRVAQFGVATYAGARAVLRACGALPVARECGRALRDYERVARACLELVSEPEDAVRPASTRLPTVVQISAA